MPVSPSDNFVREATKGVLDWTAEKIREFIIRFKERKLAFVSDIKIINMAIELRKKPEWDFFKNNVQDSDIRILFQMGLTLKRLEDEGRPLEWQNLRQIIFRKYERWGLHVAQVVQNGIFSKYVGVVLDRALTAAELKSEILSLFKNIDNTVSFIQIKDNVEKKTNEITSKILAHSPRVYILSSARTAMDVCKKIRNSVMNRISDYESELYESGIKRIYFLNKIIEIT